MECLCHKLNLLGLFGANSTDSFVKFALLSPKIRAFQKIFKMTEENKNTDNSAEEATAQDLTPEMKEEPTEATSEAEEVKEVSTETKAVQAETKETEEVEQVEEVKEVSQSEENAVEDDVEAGSEEDSTLEEEANNRDSEGANDEFVIELPDLEPLSLEELFALTQNLVQEHPVQNIKEHVDQIKHHFFTKAKAERLVSLEAFVADGGNEIDFEFEQPIRDQFKQLIDTYRKERQAYVKELEQRLNDNLKKREEIIESIKGLLQSEEKFSETFQQFRDLQGQWREIGPVPRASSSEVWRTYHHHVENFYDYLRLNDELRDLDFKKNLEHKEQLIAKAKELAALENVHEAFKGLQELHKEWKEEGGPVAKEHRDSIWETFSAITKEIHDKRHAHYDKLKGEWEEHLKTRHAICDKIEAIAKEQIDSHGKWQNKIKEVRSLADEFRAAGRVPKAKSTEVWNRFREALRQFNHAKNEFYKGLKDEYKQHLEQRQALIAKAEALKDNENWKETAEALKKLQREWKKVGTVAHSDNQKTWKKFHDACDHFFSRRKAHFTEQDAAYEANYTAKEKLMAELEAYAPEADSGKAVATLKDFMARWREIGFVPRGKMGIDKNWRQLVDLKFDQLKLSGKEKGAARFKNKIEILAAKGGRDLNREKDQIKRELNGAQDELRTLEANIQLLSPTGNKSNPLVAQVEKSIAEQRVKIEQLRDKMKLVREVEKNEAGE